jgi:ABC-2 type transport system ATP-binding protein
MTPAAAIRTEGLTKYYGPVVAVENLDLAVDRGEVYGFLGPNGAGKTTTIRMLLDLVRATSGRALVDGLDCRRASRTIRARIGYLPAELPLYREMTGSRYLRFLAALQSAPVDRAWLQRLLARFDVGDVDLRRRLGHLSHGMKRKFGLLQALMGRPPLLVLDEPTSGLDPLMIEAFAETVHELKAEGATTIFLSSHVLSEVERLCDRVGIIRRGRLARETSIPELRREMPRRVRVTFTSAAPEPPPALSKAVTRQTADHWILEWHGPIGPALDAMRGLGVADIDIDPFKLEDYVLQIYAGQDVVGRT